MDDKSLDTQVREAEERIIRATLENTRWNVTKTALILGVNRTQLYHRLRRFGLIRNPRKANGG